MRDDITSPASRNETGKQADTRRRTATTTRHTGRGTGCHIEQSKRNEAREETHKSGRKRTKWDETEHKASSRRRPETAVPTSETAPETDTMEQIDRPRHERTDPHRPSNRPPDPTRLAGFTPVSLFASPPDTKNGETRKSGTERRSGTVSKQGDGTSKTERGTGREHEKEND